jgi:hypothetical protein
LPEQLETENFERRAAQVAKKRFICLTNTSASKEKVDAASALK